MMKKPTIFDVAERAGVPGYIVSRVINDHPDVPVSTRHEVAQAMAELGYQPCAATRHPDTNQRQRSA